MATMMMKIIGKNCHHSTTRLLPNLNLILLPRYVNMNKPDLFNKINGITRSAAVLCLDEYVPKMNWKKEGGRLIDVGGADGSVTQIMRKYIPSNYELISCDVNERMVKYAREYCAGDNITFRVQDAEGELAEDLRCRFNQVFSFYTFHFVRNQEKAFSNVFNLLETGGDCLVTIVSYAPIYEIFERVAHDTKWSTTWLKGVRDNFLSPYYYMKEPEKVITEMLQKIGFINIEVKHQQLTYVMENGTKFKNVIRAVEPYGMPNDVLEDFLQDGVRAAQELNLLDKTDKCFDDHDKPIDYKYKLLVIYASKPI